jgi:hypothetical protein
MQTLERTLRDYDLELLAVIADRWDVDLASHSITDVVHILAQAMLDEQAAADTWDRLDDAQRGALQTLLGSGGAMSAAMFARLFGPIREMGPGRLEREKPYLNPVSVAEALYYRGLIARGFDEAAAGPQPVIYVPVDLARILPTHHTGFDLTAEEDEAFPDEDEEEPTWGVAAGQPDEITQANTTIVDDLTTLLAYLQVATVEWKEGDGTLPQGHVNALTPFLLTPGEDRLALLLGLAHSLTLVAPREGLLKPLSPNARRWLEAPRGEQVRLLAVAWRESTLYNELHFLPGLIVESAENDPRLARQVILRALEALPPDSWWLVEQVIAEIKEVEPDFQRPGGDYESWYIRTSESGEYLMGFGTWDDVNGAMLRFILTGPLHWLGLADLGRYAGQTLGHLNAYGRALISGGEWPSPPEAGETVALRPDGIAEVSRKLSRYDRFQLARFTEWLGIEPAYRYRISPRGLRRAGAQGIQAEHIRSFLARTTKASLPQTVETLLERWDQAAEAEASIERLSVLRMTSSGALDAVLNEPALRRYLGARLGPEAVIVRPGQTAALLQALAERGVFADAPALDEDQSA